MSLLLLPLLAANFTAAPAAPAAPASRPARRPRGGLPPPVAPVVPEPSPVPAAPPAPPPPAGPLRLLVQELRTEHVSPKVGQFTTDALVNELRKLEGVRVFGLNEVQQMLYAEEEKRALGSVREVSLDGIAQMIAFDEIVVGSLASTPSSSILSLKRLKAGAGESGPPCTRQLVARDGAEFLSVLGDAVAELLPDHQPKAGLTRGVRPELAKELNPPPLPPWVFGVVTGAAAGAGLGALTLGLLFRESERDRLALLAGSSLANPVEATQVAELERRSATRASATNALLITTGGLALGATIAALFTNWRPVNSKAALTISVGPGAVGISGRLPQ
jgi:hypothetical protein